MGKIALLLLVVFLANCASGSEPHFKGRMARTATIVRYFHFVNKLTGYCLQAGSSTGYGVVENEDRAVIMPCDGGEPTQIFSNADYYGVGTEQFKDLSSGKCLTMEVDTSEVYMYDCGYYNDNQWWDMFRGW
ncbi:hypothetical protein Fcan01_25346 [Folsomia candida]|uniref:Uncharacterized protein n=1 Tax=Folsomia candida TaxID=158441 RepID=A0A226D4T7_FOLCA|nr:hypothetical protein Fcan01_25346 [Folsomia candida]